jgi:hypothetical protein
MSEREGSFDRSFVRLFAAKTKHDTKPKATEKMQRQKKEKKKINKIKYRRHNGPFRFSPFHLLAFDEIGLAKYLKGGQKKKKKSDTSM